jgi:putative Holliday junction resolvase
MHERILAVDYGTKRIGLAVTDPLGYTVQPLPFLPNSGRAKAVAELVRIAGEKSARLVVVGLPKSLDGSLGVKARECSNFASMVREASGLPVELFDERFTSVEAERILVEQLDLSREKRKQVRDSLSACLLLESFIQARKASGGDRE